MIEKFAGYGFNKSHSTAYALIAYMTAYLKAHYPVEFMAALLSRRYCRPQLQEERLARRTSGRLPAHEHHGRAAGRESPADADFTRARRQDLFRPGGHQGLRRRRRPTRSAPSASAAARFATCSTSANASIPAVCNRTAIESLIKAGAFDSLRRQAGPMDGGRSIGPCRPGARHAGRSPQRPKRTVRRCRREPASTAAAGKPAQRCRMGRAREAGRGKRSAGLLSVEPSAGRAYRNVRHLLHATRPSKRPRSRIAPRRMLGGMIGLDQVLAHQESTPRQHGHQVRDVGSGRHGRHHALHSLARGFCPASAIWSKPIASWPCAARSTSGPAAKKPISSSTN